MGTQYRCHNQQRARLVRDHSTLNGIDYLEVLDQEAPPGSPRQRTLFVHCFKDLPALRRENVHLEGGVRVRPVEVEWAFPASEFSTKPEDAGKAPNNLVTSAEREFFAGLEDKARVLVVRTSSTGDFPTYTLRLVASSSVTTPPPGFDPQLSEVEFSFKVECPSDFDCKQETVCPPQKPEEPKIDYLAKDYESFRRLMLDRLSVIMPAWKERNPADLQVALVELLAYVGDHLSYYQDAVATEAYLGTAHHRTSVRRHARLLDYPMHDGCNARVWVAVEVEPAANDQVLPGPSELKPGTLLLTRSSAAPGPLPADRVGAALREGAVAFETLHDLTLYAAHNEIKFYTWGDEACCLPKGATQAFLKDDPAKRLRLRRGDVLIFEEKTDPQTGTEADANPLRRHAVRLTYVNPEATQDADGRRTPAGLLTDPLTGQAYVEVRWDPQDALPFALCLSVVIEGQARSDLSVARGNVVLADHGQTVQETLPALDADTPPRRYRPSLSHGPLTQQGRVKSRKGTAGLLVVDPEAPASAAMRWEMRHVRPAIRLVEPGSEDRPWLPQRDLLGSDRFAREFVAEVEDDERTRLRFGDDVLGAQPETGFQPQAINRVGNGRAGNVGRESIVNVVLKSPPSPGVVDPRHILKVRNPMPAQGGADPEGLDQVRLYAPQAFRRQERAVTAADYAEVTERHPEVQKAAATIRWTGSWYTVFITIDRKGGRAVDADFEREIRDFLERYRLAGHDLEVNGPLFVPLDLKLVVCVRPGYYKSEVKKALLEAFSNRDLAVGRGFFHPDNVTFGTPVYLSQIYAVAMQVPGVQSVEVERFQRLGKAPNRELEDGVLRTGRLEVVRLDNDPNFPENGRLELVMRGGL
jgi:hypothetical protein